MIRHRGRGRRVAVMLSALLVINAAGAAGANGAQSATKVRLGDEECRVMMAVTGQPASRACYMVVESSGSVSDGVQASATCYVPAGYTHCGSVAVQLHAIIPQAWSVTATATYVRNSSTGKVSWQSVTCTQWAFGFTVKINWCGSYHNGLPDTNFGSNFDVSAVWEGSPITASHGVRASINGYSGAGCCVQSW
jgi:hypothetical protein